MAIGARARPGDEPEPGPRLVAASAAKELAALATVEPDARLAWYGPPMRAGNAAIARLMETWAHGQDIVDALESAGHRPIACSESPNSG